MPDGYVEKLTIESVVFRVPQEYAALVVYVNAKYGLGWNIRVWKAHPTKGYNHHEKIATVPTVRKVVQGKTVCVAIFPRLIPDTYIVETSRDTEITLFPGFISEIDQS